MPVFHYSVLNHGTTITITADCLNRFHTKPTVFKIILSPIISFLRNENKCCFCVHYLLSQILRLAYGLVSTKKLSRSFCTPSISNTVMAPSFRQVPSLLKHPLFILPFSLGASWYILTLPWLYPFWGFSHSVLRGGSRSMRASYIPEHPELLLLAGLCWMHWGGSVCHKHMLSVLVVCLTLQTCWTLSGIRICRMQPRDWGLDLWQWLTGVPFFLCIHFLRILTSLVQGTHESHYEIRDKRA